MDFNKSARVHRELLYTNSVDSSGNTISNTLLDTHSLLRQKNKQLKADKIIKHLIELNMLELYKYRILDAGCGNGSTLRSLIEHGAMPERCHGIDIVKEAIDFAKRNSPKLIDYKIKPIHNTGYVANSMNLILNLGVITTIPDDNYIRSMNNEFYRLLQKDGVLFLSLLLDEPSNEHYRHFKENSYLEELSNLFPSFKIVAAENFFSSAIELNNKEKVQYFTDKLINKTIDETTKDRYELAYYMDRILDINSELSSQQKLIVMTPIH
jgi:2-polyprenyl-3-methyl-5-hydroxy-6-metoxy-1,4-benzoquinol methylase